jgi:hypothetical protein
MIDKYPSQKTTTRSNNNKATIVIKTQFTKQTFIIAEPTHALKTGRGSLILSRFTLQLYISK